MAKRNVPDLIIGIDFGMTCTGVAWARPAFNTTGALTSWPETPGTTEVKVPTRLTYNHNKTVAKWGFACEPDEDGEGPEIFEWFKVYLEPKALSNAIAAKVAGVPQSIDVVRRLYVDFMRELYEHIKISMAATSGSWNDKRVQFLFSTPTTWVSQDIIHDFKRLVQAAGFGSDNPALHTVELALTEAEAVAVYTFKSPPVQFSNGEILLVCDAGGGTTDLGLVEVEDADFNKPVLKQVAQVSGIGVGSTLINRAFEGLVQDRIDSHRDGTALPPDVAARLAKGMQFANIKHNFGSASGTTQSFFLKIGIPSFSSEGLRIRSGKMEFSRAEIQGLFDRQIDVIVKKINDQLNWLATNKTGKHVKYLVLSGGLGSSDYVKSKIEQSFSMNQHPSAPRMAVIRSEDPRLAVCKGLVYDRKQKIDSGKSALTTRVARASYGVICRQRYNPAIHMGADVVSDDYKSDVKWATDQIDWFIRRGDLIDADTAYKENRFQKKLKPGNPNRIWTTEVVVSENEQSNLPQSMKQAGVRKLCTVTSDLKDVNEMEFEKKNRHCWQGRPYFLANFSIRAVIGPADLTFELWFKGTQYARGHNSISVEFDNVSTPMKPDIASQDYLDRPQPDHTSPKMFRGL